MGLLNFADNAARITFRNQFFIPFAGYRMTNSSSVTNQEWDANFVSSSPNGTELFHYFGLTNTYYLTVGSSSARGNAGSVRCFKNLSLDSTSA